MTLAARTTPEPRLTYEAYLAGPETERRCEILDGARIWMTNPTRRHQRVLGELFHLFRAFERASGRGQALVAPCDILIRRQPLRTRQPDLLFISHERLSRCPPETDAAPLPIGPELVVEVLSPSETRRTVTEKMADYRSVGVQEVWIVSPGARTIEVLEVRDDGHETVGRIGPHGEARSRLFSDLVVPLADVFDA